MSKPIVITVTKEEAIKEMEESLERLKKCSDTDTILMVSYDLSSNKSLGRKRVNSNGGRKIMNKSKTFVLIKDNGDFPVSTLSMYTEHQMDIRHIIPIGIKHDMVLFPKLEWIYRIY